MGRTSTDRSDQDRTGITMLNLDDDRHAAADARLRAESIIWLTTVSASGQPQSSPVWFGWDGTEFLIYGSKDGQKTRNIAGNPRVGLHLDGNGQGGDNVIFEGKAAIDQAAASADSIPAEYTAKYEARIEAFGWTLASLVRDYPHVIRVTPARVRIW
jgi:PPOX class probable F420-dependent enzyme